MKVKLEDAVVELSSETIYKRSLAADVPLSGSSGCVSGTSLSSHSDVLGVQDIQTEACCVRPSSTSQRLIQSFSALRWSLWPQTLHVPMSPPSLDVLHLRAFVFIQFVNLEHISVIDNETVFLLKPTSM